MTKIDLSLILACYNEGPTFEKSVVQIVSVLNKLKNPWEIIFVEDQSTDETKKSIEKLIREIKNSRVIFHSKNTGRGKSVADGLKAAKGEVCGYLDVDLEVSPTYIPLFVKEVENGSDLVVGKRFYENSLDSISRVIASKLYATAVKSFLNLPIEDTEAGYKFFNRKRILSVLPKVKNKHWFWDTEICAQAYWAGLKITQVPVLFKRRVDKKSTVRLIPDTIDYVKSLVKLKSQMSNFKSQTNPKF